MELREQLLRTVVQVDDCWIRGIEGNPLEYSHMRIGGVLYHAHRIAYELFNDEPVPEGMDVLHRCDRKRCVNPAHLFIGDAKTNVQDAISKGRFHFGERTGGSKLTEELVKEIRQQYAKGLSSIEGLASDYGVRPHTIWAIIKRITWRHVE